MPSFPHPARTLTFVGWRVTICPMTPLPEATTPPGPKHPPTLRTHIAYLADEQVARPLGVRVVEPPLDTRQATRGNLYAVVELIGNHPEREALSERLLSAIQRTYYTAKGSQSHVLSEALREADRSVQEFNAQSTVQPLRAGMIVVALLGERLLIVGLGSALALVTSGSNVDVYPPSAQTALVSESEPQWEIYRQELPVGGSLFLGSGRCQQQLTLRLIASTVAYVDEENYSDAAAYLREQAGHRDLPGLLIVCRHGLATPSTTAVIGDGEDVGAVKPAGLPAAFRRSRPGAGLPAAVGAQPPVHSVSMQEPPLTQPATPPTQASIPEHSPAAEQTEAVALSAMTTPSAVNTLPASDPPRITSPLTVTSGVTTGAKTSLQRARDFLGNMLPDPASAHPATATNRQNTATVRSVAAVATPAEQAYKGTGELPVAPTAPPVRTQGGRARLYILAAVIILALIPVIVFAVYWQQGRENQQQGEQAIELANARYASANDALNSGDKVNARAQLGLAQSALKDAQAILGRDDRIDTLNQQIQLDLAEVLQVQPLYGLVAPLVRFPPEAQPQRVLVVDQDIYVMDVGRQLVQRFRLDPTTNTVPDQEGEIVLRAGDTVGNATVGRLADMAWQLPIPGIEDKPNLLVLDHSNNIFRYDARVEGAALLEVEDKGSWRIPTQIETYSGRFYVADEGAGQIFKYESRETGKITGAPEPWFSVQTPVNLTGLQNLKIDGDIWLLFNNGTILRYRQGEQVPFSLENSVGLVSGPVDMVVGDQGDSMIYLADSQEERILVFDKNGKYQRQLVAPEGHILRGLSGLFVDEVTSSLYILTQSALYEHALVN